MENGIKKAAGETGADAWMVGPTQADAAQQVKAVEDLIARHVDVIAVVPNDAMTLVAAIHEHLYEMADLPGGEDAPPAVTDGKPVPRGNGLTIGGLQRWYS